MNTLVSVDKAGVYHLDTYSIKSIKRQRKTFDSLAELAKYLYRIATGDDVPKANNPNVLSIINAYIEYAINVKNVSASYRRRMEVAKKPLAELYKTDVELLTKDRFDRYVKARLKQVKPATVKAEYVLLHAALEYAVSRDIISKNPLKNYWKGIKSNHTIHDVPQISHLQAIFDNLDIDSKKAIYFLLHTGCRLNDMLTLQVNDVTSNNGTISIRFRHSKFGRSRTVQVSALPFSLPESGFAFTYKNKPWKPNCLLVKLKKACKTASVHELNLHDMRRIHATYSIASGESLYSVMSRCGWKSIAMVQRYAQIAPQYVHTGSWKPAWMPAGDVASS